MKRRSFRTYINPNGILRWSTLCILAALPGCNSPVATDNDVAMAENQAQIEQLDREHAKLLTRPAIYMEKDGRGWKEMRWDEKSLGI